MDKWIFPLKLFMSMFTARTYYFLEVPHDIQEIFISDKFNTLTISGDKSCNEIELYCAASMVLG